MVVVIPLCAPLGDVGGMLRDDAHHHQKVETAAATPEDRNDYFFQVFYAYLYDRWTLQE